MAETSPQSGPKMPLPDGAFDRIYEAMLRSAKYLPATTLAKVKELFDPNTLVAFVALLVIWGGFQFTPIAWVADAVLTVYAFWQLGNDIAGVIAAGRAAVAAETDEALEQAAQAIAAAMTDTVADVIAAILGNYLFKVLKGKIKSFSGKLLPERFTPEGEPSERELARKRVIDEAVAAGTGVAIERGSVALGHAVADWQAGLNIGLGLLGSLVLLGGLIAVARSGRRRR